MNDNSDQKKRWKKEAEQLKKDLSSREKVFKKNPVKIKFGPQYTNQKANNSIQPLRKSTKQDDENLRRLLGI